MRRLADRWEIGLMALIRDRYACTQETAVQIRSRFLDWEMDAAGIPMLLGPDDRPIFDDGLLAVLDGCAHPEWAEQARQQAAEALQRSNTRARALAARITCEGLTCPHCRRHSKDVRFVEHPRPEPLYFICRHCGRSFVPTDLEDST